MAGQDMDSSIRFETVDVDYHLGEGKEFRRKDKACDEVFQQFVQLRGEILTQAIVVEKELDRLISQYFVPGPIEGQSEEVLRRDAFVDIILGQGGFMFSSKIKAVQSILESAEISQPSSTMFYNTLRPIMDIRNLFAHSKVGVDWKTSQIALWDSKKRKWGFPVFTPEGKKKENEWHDEIPNELDKQYSEYCRFAISMIHGIRAEISKLCDSQSTCENKGN